MAASGALTELDPKVGTLTSNNFCTSNAGGTAIVCTTAGISLATQVTGNLPVANLNSGTNADSSHYWRGDGTWATVSSSLPSLTSAYIWVGNGSNAATAVSMSGDVTITNGGVTAIGSGKVTNAMLAGSIAASKLVGTDIATVGTITSGAWNAGAITSSGTITGTLFSGSGASLTSLNASNIASGTVGTAWLGSGTANSSTYLRGDSTWATVSAGVSEGGAGCTTVGTASKPGSGSQGTACTDGSYFIGRYAGFNYFATASDDLAGTTWANAGTLCNGLNRHGHTDWFRPSLPVLQMMYENRTQIGGFASGAYWAASSYQVYGWAIDFTTGDQKGTYSGSYFLRCARRS